MNVEQIAAEILRLSSERGPEKSICPSEVARSLAKNTGSTEWQRLLPAVRSTAADLARTGRIDVLRKGRRVEPAELRGVIRLRIRILDEH